MRTPLLPDVSATVDEVLEWFDLLDRAMLASTLRDEKIDIQQWRPRTQAEKNAWESITSHGALEALEEIVNSLPGNSRSETKLFWNRILAECRTRLTPSNGR